MQNVFGRVLLPVVLALVGCSREREPEPIAIVDAAVDVAPPAPTREVTIVENPQVTPAKRPGWNVTKIDWQTYDRGLDRAKAEQKPICLVIYTTWCTHCRAYSHVFEDERIVERARDFIMIRVDPDNDPDVAKKYAPDGRYVPRTYFLSAGAVLDASIHVERPKFRFFYDEDDPSSLLDGMNAAIRKLGKR